MSFWKSMTILEDFGRDSPRQEDPECVRRQRIPVPQRTPISDDLTHGTDLHLVDDDENVTKTVMNGMICQELPSACTQLEQRVDLGTCS
ncbi:hypothetical protein BaRGS_00029774 [Batillaria attramentaria]|uniref:Uncharacterized protein n=1 Tax=Batillaria attramentaria TaxID=370345 RepID=A0ABD0JVQ4_9CAEN